MSLEIRREEGYEAYEQAAREVRADIIGMTCRAESGHPGSSFSSTELLVWLYSEVLNVDPERPDAENRDRLVFSKGHASPALYAVLARAGFFDRERLKYLRRTDGLLEGHATHTIPGVEFSSGSLGQGLSFAIGTALNARLEELSYESYVVLGDGELQEGNVWEAIMQAGHRGLDNLVAVVEQNGAQNDGLVEQTKKLAPLDEKFRTFGWHVTLCDGHDFDDIERAFNEVAAADGAPAVIIADTEKGHGISFMKSNKLGFHSTILSPEQAQRAYDELGVEPDTPLEPPHK